MGGFSLHTTVALCENTADIYAAVSEGKQNHEEKKQKQNRNGENCRYKNEHSNLAN